MNIFLAENGEMMKSIEVVAAVIISDGKIFATQRSKGEFKDLWEFPGGKMELGESREAALIREIKEELDVEVFVDEFLCTVNFDYPSFHLTMHCFWCSIAKGSIKLLEHKASKWLSKEELPSVEWLPADIEVISLLSR